MARLGIDFGTTNTVVVASDRGRYPVVPHASETAIGRIVRDVFPSLAAYEDDGARLLFGPDAERRLARPEGVGVVRSLKRLLRDWVGGGRIATDVRPGGFDTLELLTAFARALRSSLASSGLFHADEPLEAVITWPANANGAQRWVTRTAFRQGGFDIVGTVSEPAAAAIEYASRLTHGDHAAARRVRATVVVFDFGGGTFDASLVRIDGTEFTVLDTVGIDALGGDDLDLVLARLFARRVALDVDALSPLRRDLLLQQARRQKETISAGGVRSLTLVPADLGIAAKPCTVSVAAYWKALTDVIAPAIDGVARLVAAAPCRVDGIYLVGGSSRLPLVLEAAGGALPRPAAGHDRQAVHRHGHGRGHPRDRRGHHARHPVAPLRCAPAGRPRAPGDLRAHLRGRHAAARARRRAARAARGVLATTQHRTPALPRVHGGRRARRSRRSACAPGPTCSFPTTPRFPWKTASRHPTCAAATTWPPPPSGRPTPVTVTG